MVAHSYGNMAIVYYMLQHGSDTSLPKLVKQVDIAGHFNGIIGIDEPENITLDDEGKTILHDRVLSRALVSWKSLPSKVRLKFLTSLAIQVKGVMSA